jgi:hypothetical protein
LLPHLILALWSLSSAACCQPEFNQLSQACASCINILLGNLSLGTCSDSGFELVTTGSKFLVYHCRQADSMCEGYTSVCEELLEDNALCTFGGTGWLPTHILTWTDYRAPHVPGVQDHFRCLQLLPPSLRPREPACMRHARRCACLMHTKLQKCSLVSCGETFRPSLLQPITLGRNFMIHPWRSK